MIYICGKVKGKLSLRAFNKAEDYMRNSPTYSTFVNQDYLNPVAVFNAIGVDYEKMDTKTRLNFELSLLQNCDTIYMLNGWEDDGVATLLCNYANLNGYRVVYSKKF
jgi:hypothetical protein